MNVDAVGQCPECKNVIHTNVGNEVDKCRVWLENCTPSECGSSSACGCDGSSSDLTTTDCTSTTDDDFSYNSEGVAACDQVCAFGISDVDLGQLRIAETKPANVYHNVVINKSRKVHLGNVTYVQGPIIVNQTSNVLNQITNSDDDDRKAKWPQNSMSTVRLVDRKNWLAQPPVAEYSKLENPAKYVIICHSATEEAPTHSDNILLIRIIQQFHIESRGWDDIGYNFLIGCDGNTYLGRGWGIQGAHTKGYNKFSVGICFVGCFINHLPSQSAFRQAKSLIEQGVAEGHIDPDYSLIGACQCVSTESPGRKLFEEIKTWQRFDASISIDTPAKQIDN